jgi:hypothetical protein
VAEGAVVAPVSAVAVDGRQIDRELGMGARCQRGGTGGVAAGKFKARGGGGETRARERLEQPGRGR